MTPYRLEIQKSRRRSISLAVLEDLTVQVKAPLSMSDEDIRQFLQKHSRWIEKHLRLRAERLEKPAPEFSIEQVAQMKRQVRETVESRVAHFSALMGVRPTGIGITSARTRWGSCSAQNRLNFTYRLALLPPEAVDYIVVHELAHIRVKNHSAKFYHEVEKYLPDYRERIALLKQAQRELGL